mmetsp:Transcript_84399/g.149284  ORF Transcript_84399/g.149284 Transcript_84399/m.149284 type:complete len:708 (+) Transcript_84399:70-2193(+)
MELRRPPSLTFAAPQEDGHDGSPKQPTSPHSRATSFGALGPLIAFGECSLFDIEVIDPDSMPYELPAAQYLEETLAGLHGAPAPEHAQGSKNWKRLQAVLETEEASKACELLAWVSVGSIFDTIIEKPCLAEIKKRLAQSWFELTLIIGRVVDGYKQNKDWVQEVLPAVFVQAIYRMLVDAFPPEQRSMVQSSKEVLEKLSHIAHYEVAGFQANPGTWEKLRKRLFCSSVLAVPHLNQRESMASERKREKLERERAVEKDFESAPLVFGTDAKTDPLNDDQLEHVMAMRPSRNGHGFKKSLITDAAFSPMQAGWGTSTAREEAFSERSLRSLEELKARAEEELGVDRYEAFSSQAEELLSKQLNNLYEVPPDERLNAESLFGKVVNKEQEDAPQTDASGESPETPRNKSRSGAASAKHGGRQTVRGSMDGTNAARREREKREAEAAERRRRDELLDKQIGAPLSQELRQRSLDTSLVSPVLDRLAPSDSERQLLPSLPSLKQQVKMNEPQPQHLPSISEQPKKEPKVKAKEAIARRRLALKPTLKEETETRKKKDGKLTNSASLPQIPHNGVVTVNLESQSLKHEVAAERLQKQMEAFRARSFDEVKKANDVVTGQKKQRLDPGTLETEETSFINKLEQLVGSRSTPALQNSYPFLKKQPLKRGGRSSSSVAMKSPARPSETNAFTSSPQARKAWNELTVVNVLSTR